MQVKVKMKEEISQRPLLFKFFNSGIFIGSTIFHVSVWFHSTECLTSASPNHCSQNPSKTEKPPTTSKNKHLSNQPTLNKPTFFSTTSSTSFPWQACWAHPLWSRHDPKARLSEQSILIITHPHNPPFHQTTQLIFPLSLGLHLLLIRSSTFTS